MNIAIMTVIYIALFLLMLPLRGQAYFDDFAYIKNVEEFVITGNLKITDWASTTLVFPVLWGALFAKIFGFSIKILHLSNIVLFYFGMLAFYGILRQFNIDKFKSVIITLFFLSYPWVFQFLFSFMSDTFYLSLMLISIYFYIKGINNHSYSNLFLGSIFASLAFLTRQLAATIPISILLVLLIQSKIHKSLLWKDILASLVLPIITILGYYQWIAIVGPPAAGYIFFNAYTKREIIEKFAPQNWQRFGDTNRLYWDLFLQRPSIYFVSITNHLLPIVILFILSFTKFKKILFSNLKTIFSIALGGMAYGYMVWLIWKDKPVHRVPWEILGVDNMIGNWEIYWPKLFFIGVPFWIILATMSWVKIKSFLVKREHSLIPTKIFVWGLILSSSFVFYKAFEDSFSVDLRPQLYENHILKSVPAARVFYVLFSKPYVWIETFREIWLFVLVILLTLTIIYIFLTRIKAKFKNFNLPILFIMLIFLGNFSLINFLAHSHWEEYTIAFAPLLILIVGFLLKDFYIPKIWGTILIFLLLLFSWQITRNRYQQSGADWELGTQIVKQGVHPARVGVSNLTWHRYWLWEDAFNEMVNTKYGGNKYLVDPAKFDPLNKSVPKEGVYYNVSSVDADEKLSPDIKGATVSPTYWIFDRNTIITFRKTIVSKVR